MYGSTYEHIDDLTLKLSNFFFTTNYNVINRHSEDSLHQAYSGRKHVDHIRSIAPPRSYHYEREQQQNVSKGAKRSLLRSGRQRSLPHPNELR